MYAAFPDSLRPHAQNKETSLLRALHQEHLGLMRDHILLLSNKAPFHPPVSASDLGCAPAEQFLAHRAANARLNTVQPHQQHHITYVAAMLHRRRLAWL